MAPKSDSSSSLELIGDDAGILLRLRAEDAQSNGRVATVVEDHVGVLAVRPLEDAVGVVPIFREALAFHSEHRRAFGGDRGGGVVLGGEDVARGPTHFGAERLQRLDQHRGLDGHVQRAGNAGALQRLLRAVLLAHGHQARHFGFGNFDFLAAPSGQGNIFYDVISSAHRAPSFESGERRFPKGKPVEPGGISRRNAPRRARGI